MSDERVVIRSYRWRDEVRESSYAGYGYGEPKKAEDHATIFADLWLRVDTLKDAKRPVLLTLEKDFLHLATMVPVPPPEPPAPTIINNTVSASTVKASQSCNVAGCTGNCGICTPRAPKKQKARRTVRRRGSTQKASEK